MSWEVMLKVFVSGHRITLSGERIDQSLDLTPHRVAVYAGQQRPLKQNPPKSKNRNNFGRS